MTPAILKHLSGENIGRFPVWMMRQAGRYLPSYREIRKRHSFWEMATIPEVAAEVSLLPTYELPVDAIIFFSDILTLPYSLRIPIEIKEKVGPVIGTPLSSESDFRVFEQFDPSRNTPYIAEALQIISKKKNADVALFGFAGAPWTVSCYLIEGQSSRHFEKVKGWMFRDPNSLSSALKMVALSTVKYLKQQHAAGAQVVQLFDTWIGEMPRSFFVQHYKPILESIFSELKKTGIPAIYFTKNSSHVLEDFKGLSAAGLSVDSLLTLADAEKKTGGNFFLQGNLDPILLLNGTEGQVRKATRELVLEARKLSKPAILNLGHGILPQTPVENARAFIEEARALWL